MSLAPRFRKVVTPIFLSVSVLYLAGCSSSEERAQAHYDRGVELADQGEFVKAGLEFRNALKLDKDNVEALYALGNVVERQGEIQPAFRIYTSVAEQDPEHLPVRFKLIYMLLAANQVDAAQKYIDQVTALDSDNSETLVAQAAIALRTGKREEAERLAKDALKSDPELVDALVVLATSRMMASDPAGALEYLAKTPERSEGDIGLQVLRLSALDALGDEPGIEQLFGKLVELYPEQPAFTQAWARWYLSKDRKDDAELIVRQYATNNPANDSAQLQLIAFLNTYKDMDSARDELEKIIKQRDEQSGESLDLRIALGRLLFTSGAQTEAIDLMQSILTDTKDDQTQNRVRNILGAMFVDTEELDRAEELANEVLANDKKNVDALRLRASVKLLTNDSASAVDDILVALNEAPENAQLNGMLASAYERNGSSALAEEQYAKALALTKNSPTAGLPMVQFLLRHGKVEQAHRVLEAIRENAPTNVETLKLLAQLKLATQDWLGAQQVAETLRKLEESGEAGTADKITAAALEGLDRRADSLKVLEDSFASTENQQDILPSLIRAYVQSGQHEAAISHLESVLETEPTNILAQTLLGSVYTSMGRIDEAEKAFKAAATNDEGALGDTSLAQFYISTRNLDEAEKAVRDGMKKDPGSAALRLMLTSIMQQTERFDEAIAEYEDMFAQDPQSTVVANDLASLLSERRGDEQSLERAFEIAQRFRNSEIPQYLDTLGWIYYLRGEYSSALPLLRSAAQKLPDLGLAQYHLGMVLAAAGQTEQAIETFEKALELRTLMTEEDLANAEKHLDDLKNAPSAVENN
ncbi:tetratricopeptide repeat protein [Roseibium aggregatum]|uniref:Tetratricopeptide repeat protein n=1 Tax=Roseibium aggregatum TaxID=187304 RepID=A0A939J3P6_9HYPH|nr:tetratricopeptide repeat protein [Roseibium aggregatum]MBN9669884.1 tetratricopeptide repeat protein [Roseibium aggregatum]